jgi:hypothetical protein
MIQPPRFAISEIDCELCEKLLHVDVVLVINFHDGNSPPAAIARVIDQERKIIDRGIEGC